MIGSNSRLASSRNDDGGSAIPSSIRARMLRKGIWIVPWILTPGSYLNKDRKSDNPADGFSKSRTIIYSEKSAHEYILRNLFTEKSVDFESISIRFQQYIYKMYNPVNFPCRTKPTSFGRALTDSLRKGHQRESHYFMYTQRESSSRFTN